MGEVSNSKWPFGLSHNRHGLAGAGWARSQNTDQLPVSVAMAGTNMRLSPHAYRELHWHKQGEWALMYLAPLSLPPFHTNKSPPGSTAACASPP
jgi:hypothetical protein